MLHSHTSAVIRLVAVLGILILGLSACSGDKPAATPSTDVPYTSLEHNVYKETNKLRTNPKAYEYVLKDILARISDNIYYPKNTTVGVRMKEGDVAVKEAITAMHKLHPLPILKWSDALARLAREHVNDTGQKGIVGHTSSTGKTMAQRLSGVMKSEHFTSVAENISYGLDNGEDVVAHLFIDDGVPGRGHRKNLSIKKLNYTGVACGYHSRYRQICVAIYAYRSE